jgi:hypothetical protein
MQADYAVDASTYVRIHETLPSLSKYRHAYTDSRIKTIIMRMRVEGHETRVLEKSDYSSGKFLALDEKT